jgi:hypothetical protein
VVGLTETSRRGNDTEVAERSWIHLANEYFWSGEPRYGAMTVSVDGKALGRVPQFCTFRIPVTPGERSVQVRLLWFKSRPVTIAAMPGETIRLSADFVRDLPAGRRLLRMVLHPRRALVLARDEDEERAYP